MKNFKIGSIIFAIFIAMILSSCGGGGGGSDSGGGTGTLSVGLTDASTDEYQAVYVTISEVKVHRSETAEDDEGGWITVASPNETFNLLELVNGVMEGLGVAELESGTYTQMRLYLGLLDPEAGATNKLGDIHPYPNYVIDMDDDAHELKVPSGYQTGIKLVHKFEIVSGLTVDLVLDFDASASVVKAGASGKYLLKPTIKITDTVENAVISGTVKDFDNGDGINNASVSAQSAQACADMLPLVPITFTSTLTAGTSTEEIPLGEYMMYLPPNNYNIVAYKSGFLPECKNITTELDLSEIMNFELISVETASVTVNVSGISDVEENIPGAATISFRQCIECLSLEDFQAVEVDKLNVGNGDDYKINLPVLPVGEMITVVASSDGLETASLDITVSDQMVLDIKPDEATGMELTIIDSTPTPEP